MDLGLWRPLGNVCPLTISHLFSHLPTFYNVDRLEPKSASVVCQLAGYDVDAHVLLVYISYAKTNGAMTKINLFEWRPHTNSVRNITRNIDFAHMLDGCISMTINEY